MTGCIEENWRAVTSECTVRANLISVIQALVRQALVIQALVTQALVIQALVKSEQVWICVMYKTTYGFLYIKIHLFI